MPDGDGTGGLQGRSPRDAAHRIAREAFNEYTAAELLERAGLSTREMNATVDAMQDAVEEEAYVSLQEAADE